MCVFKRNFGIKGHGNMPKSFCKTYKQALMGVMLSIVLIGMLLSFVLTSTTAYSQSVIRRIEVNGNRRVEPATVRSYLDFTTGQSYDDALVNSSLRNLFATGLFADVTIFLQGMTVVINVVENPIVNKVAFEGNAELDTSTLNSEVRLKSRAVYTRARALADAQRIVEIYRRQGHFSAVVNPQLVDLGDSRVNVIFEINEGNTTKVKSINFIGNKAFSDSQLRDIISTTQSSWLDYLTSGGIYDPERMKLDRELIRQYYLKNGYADARVVSANAELAPDASGFFLTFTVDEGALYKFGEVRVQNALPELQSKTLEGSILTLSDDIYNVGNIDKTVEKLTLATAKQGFAFARVRPRTSRNTASRKINLTYVIDEGDRVYIERINITGNGRTKDHVIRREFRLVEGDAFNPLLISRAKERLRKLGFFKSVNIRRSPGSSRDRVVIEIVIEEQPTGELAFGAGYSSAEGVIGDISITERNLMGNGQFLRFKLGGSLSRGQVDMSFTEPRFMDKNLSAGFDLFHKEVDLSDEASYKSDSTGTNLRFGFPLTENIWLSTHYRLKRDELYEVENDASFAIKDAQGKQVTSLLGSSVSYDIRNHPKNPNRGVYLTHGADFAGVGGDVKYIRAQTEARAYYPLYENVTFVGRVIAGHIEGLGDSGVRLLDLFYKGGELVRGYDKAGLGPRDAN